MPKIKTNRGAKKRFSITAKGKVKFKRSGTRHLLVGKGKASKRGKRRPGYVEEANAKAVKGLLPYG